MTGKMAKMSLVAQFDDIGRYASILTEGIESDFCRHLKAQHNVYQQLKDSNSQIEMFKMQIEKYQAELKSYQTKTEHSRNILEKEIKRRVNAEKDRDSLERQISLIRELLLRDHTGMDDETREKLAFLNNSASFRTRPSEKKLETIEESCLSFLSTSDISFDRTGDDLEGPISTRTRRSKGKRPFIFQEGPPKKKRSKGKEIEERLTEGKTLITTTRVSMPKRGEVVASSRIETIPMDTETPTSTETDYITDTDLSTALDSEETAVKVPFYTTPVTRPPRKVMISDDVPPPPMPRSTSHRTPLNQYSSTSSLNQRAHKFCTKVVYRPEECTSCGHKIKFYKNALKCQDCRTTCHPECREQVPLPCIPSLMTPTKPASALTIAAYTSHIPPMIPGLIIHCIKEIEERGLNEVGLYRVSGSKSEVTDITSRFMKRRGIPNIANADVNALCGVVKGFLMSLQESLITNLLRPDFMKAADIKDQFEMNCSLYRAVSNLPQPNRDTLAFIMLHLQRIASTPTCKMPASNLAKVFGPTLVGYSRRDLTHSQMELEISKQHNLVEKLLDLPSNYWENYVNVSQENLLTPTIRPTLNSRPGLKTRRTKTAPRLNTRTKSSQRYFDSPRLR